MNILLIGILVVLIVIIILYIFGIVPNLWSYKIISYTSYDDILLRGGTNLIILGIISFIIFNLFIL